MSHLLFGKLVELSNFSKVMMVLQEFQELKTITGNCVQPVAKIRKLPLDRVINDQGTTTSPNHPISIIQIGYLRVSKNHYNHLHQKVAISDPFYFSAIFTSSSALANTSLLKMDII